jgi:hypothetical protein
LINDKINAILLFILSGEGPLEREKVPKPKTRKAEKT